MHANRLFLNSPDIKIKPPASVEHQNVLCEEALGIPESKIHILKAFMKTDPDAGDVFVLAMNNRRASVSIQRIADECFMLEIIKNQNDENVVFETEARNGFLKRMLKSPFGEYGNHGNNISVRNDSINLINSSADGIFVADERFTVLRHNDAFRKILNVDHILNGRDNLFHLLAKTSDREMRKKFNRVIREKVDTTIEMNLKKGDIPEYYHFNLKPYHDRQSGKLYVYGFVSDVTELKALRHQIETEKNYNREIIEKLNLGFVFMDDENRFHDYNDEYLRILGIKPLDLEHRRFHDFTAAQHVNQQKKLISEMLKTGKSRTFELELLRNDGFNVPVSMTLSRLFDDKGNSAGYFAFIRDISDQKKIQQELIEHNKKIQKMISLYTAVTAKFMTSEVDDEVYQTLADSINDLVKPGAIEILAKKDNGFKSVYKNNQVTRATEIVIDVKTSLVIKKCVDRKTPIFINDVSMELNDEDIAAFPGLLRRRSAIFIPLQAQGSVGAVVVLSFDHSINDLDVMHLNMLLGMVNLASVIIDRIWYGAEQALMKSALDRYERLTAMGRIIAGVAHEINNPLSIMQLDLDELRSIYNDRPIGADDIFREMVQSLQEEIHRISSIVKQLKDYSNPENIGLEVIQVDEIFKAFPVKIFLKNLQKKGISLIMKLNCGKAMIQIPKNRMIQVIMNLLANADDAVEGKEKREIVIETGKTNIEIPMIFVNVKDNGMGIPEENSKRIFEPFFTTKKKEGTGLGLSISYSIIKSYNGEITMSSKENEGSEFTVYFPESMA